MLKIGIVGLPNVGKSLLFNLLTDSNVESADYPFTTIDPNFKTVEVIDHRLTFLAKKFASKKIIYNQIEYWDIAGLVKNASKGEGLGNKFLSNIREVDGILHVLRAFSERKEDLKVSLLEDLQLINYELILADLEQIKRWMDKNQKKIQKFSEEEKIYQLLLIAQKVLEEEKLLNSYHFKEEEKKFLKRFNFLTLKPFFYLINIADFFLNESLKVIFAKEIAYFETRKLPYKFISLKLESELLQFPPEEQKAFLESYQEKLVRLEKLSYELYRLLDYESFFTVGEKEAHAWSYKRGTNAMNGAGIIHTDFKRGFIKAVVYNYEHFYKYPSLEELKKRGLIRLEGKNYLLKDADICEFKFNL